MFELLQNSPVYLISCCFLLGLIIGSFLNVVIYRLPIMMERDFKRQATEFLQSLENKSNSTSVELQQTDEGVFNLILPHSSCPHCSHQIKAIENIPIISYLALRGKCSNCKQRISIRYPTVELVTGLISAFFAWHFGFGFELLAILILSYALICQTLIDWDTQYLLDDITYPLLWLGLLINSYSLFTTLEDAVLGAMVGYLSLWSVFWTYKIITGKEGMGYGDFKLLAMLGAWMGWQMIPLIILLSSITGSIIGGATLFFSKDKNSAHPISFGPYLASAGWIALIWGEQLIDSYFHFLSL